MADQRVISHRGISVWLVTNLGLITGIEYENPTRQRYNLDVTIGVSNFEGSVEGQRTREALTSGLSIEPEATIEFHLTLNRGQFGT